MRKKNVLICVGSGGVGKTTVAASLGVKAAQAGLKVLVLTIDPARRLATSLGLKMDVEGEVYVPDQDYKGKLYAEIIDPEKVFEKFIKESAHGKERGDRLVKNSLYRQLSTKLSGSQEFTSLERLYSAFKSGQYDLIILDTPPAQHAIDFLEAPQKIYGLFEETITQWLGSENHEAGFFRGIFNRGAQKVLSILEKITGSEFVQELGDFFDSIKGMQDVIRQRSADVHRLLVSPETGFVLVTGFGELQMKEAENFSRDLKKGGYPLSTVVASRSYPLWMDALSKATVEKMMDIDFTDSAQLKINNLCKKLFAYHEARKNHFNKFVCQEFSQVPTVRLPEMGSDVCGLKDLSKLATYLNAN